MSKPISILGIGCAYHESAACLIQDGHLIAAVEEERFSRVKHAKHALVNNADELPEQAIAFCLERGGLQHISELDFIGYALDPEARLYKNSRYRHSYPLPAGDFGTLAGEQEFYKGNLNVEKKVRAQGYQGRFFYLDHHDCHAASAFYISGYHDSAIIVLDGIAEFESSSFLKGEGSRLRKIRYDNFPNSLGFLWEKMSSFLGFTSYDSSKIMGLSSYGEAGIFKEAMEQLIHVDDRGHFFINDGLTQFRNNNFEHFEGIFNVAKRDTPVKEVTSETQVYADIALALQLVTEEIFIKLARQMRKETVSEHLCMAGGVTLNCVANGFLAYEQVFNNFYVQPAAHDAGTAIGAAYLIWHHKLGYPRQPITQSPYLGPEYSDAQILAVLERYKLSYQYREDIEIAAAEILAQGHIVAWFQGRMEIGPRALGNRSLLVDPRQAKVRELMNSKVKQREPFRPFCPSVLLEKARDWFELPDPIPDVANYMLGAFRAKKDKAHLIPAVVHFDGTSRIQTVSAETNPRFHRLLTEMDRLTGIPILLNTSFNVQEPIVCSPEDAVKTFLRTQIEYLAIGSYLVTSQ